jgi:hypothetical protein
MRYDIIKTENYLLVVDDSEIKGWYYDFYIRKVKHSGGAEYVENGITKNIIAHLPLNSPILDGVDLLPPLEDDVEKLAKENCKYSFSNEVNWSEYQPFIKGYNQAKEKYKFSEEDLRAIFSKAWVIRERYDGSDRNGYEEMYPSNWKEMDYEERQEWFFQQELKSLTKYPKYPIGFECEMEWYNPKTNQSAYSLPEITGLNDNDGCYMKTKTTPNSQGQTILVGKYIYS